MTDKLNCNICGKSTSSFFIVVGNEAICSECKGTHKSKKTPQFQKPRVFVRYICETHGCGTYSVMNMMFRHLMKDCEIAVQQTLGIIRPATYGGINGDIGRTHYLGTNQIDRLMINLANYKRFARIHSKLSRGKTSYTDRKYYNKHLRFLPINVDVDYHRLDSVFLRLKFNLDHYIETVKPRYRPSLTNEERNNMYYKDLVASFKVQVVQH